MEEENKSIEELLSSVLNQEPGNNNPLAQPIRRTGGVTGYKELGKYDKGLRVGMTQEDFRAKNQTGLKPFANAIAQTATTIVGDTISGFGYLAEALDGTNNLLENSHNLLVQLGEGISEGGRELAPIYVQDKNKGFNPLSGEWWASNLPSIGSAVSLLIPARAVSGGAAMAGRAARAGSKMSRGRKLIAKAKELGMDTRQLMNKNKQMAAYPTAIGEAFVSRHMENMMEATGTFDSAYQEALAQGMSEEQAKATAGKAASENYKQGYWALMTDVPQYLALAGVKFPKIKATKSKVLNNIQEYGEQMLGEGFEEYLQFAISEHSQKKALLGDDYKSNIAEQMGEIWGDPEASTSAWFGAIGGGVFKAVGDVLSSEDPATKAAEELGKKALNDPETENALKDLEEEAFNAQQESNIPEKNKKVIAATNKAVAETKETAGDLELSSEEEQTLLAQKLRTKLIEDDKAELNKIAGQTNDVDSLKANVLKAKLDYLEAQEQTPEIKALIKKYKKEAKEAETNRTSTDMPLYNSVATTIGLRQLQNEIELQKTLTNEKGKATSTQEGTTNQDQQEAPTKEEAKTETTLERQARIVDQVENYELPQSEKDRITDISKQIGFDPESATKEKRKKQQQEQYDKLSKRLDKTDDLEAALNTLRKGTPETLNITEDQKQKLIKKAEDKLRNKQEKAGENIKDLTLKAKNAVRKAAKDAGKEYGKTMTAEEYETALRKQGKYLDAVVTTNDKYNSVDEYVQDQVEKYNNLLQENNAQATSPEAGVDGTLGKTFTISDTGDIQETGQGSETQDTPQDTNVDDTTTENIDAGFEVGDIVTINTPAAVRDNNTRDWEVIEISQNRAGNPTLKVRKGQGENAETKTISVNSATKQVGRTETDTSPDNLVDNTEQTEQTPINNTPSENDDPTNQDDLEIYQNGEEPADLVQTPEGVFYKNSNPKSEEDKNLQTAVKFSNVSDEQRLSLLNELGQTEVPYRLDSTVNPETGFSHWTPLRTTDGESVMSEITDPYIDYEAAKRLSITYGKTSVEFFVDPNIGWNTGEFEGKPVDVNVDNFEVYIKINDVIVGKLKSYEDGRFYIGGPELKRLRNLLWEEYQNRNTSYTSGYKTVVRGKYAPKFRRTAKRDFSGTERLMGFNNFGEFVDSDGYYGQFKEGEGKPKGTSGAIYKMVEYNGGEFPYRLFTKPFTKEGVTVPKEIIKKQFPTLVAGLKEADTDVSIENGLTYYEIMYNILDLANTNPEFFKDNHSLLRTEARSIVFYPDKNRQGEFVPDFNDKLANQYKSNGKFSPLLYMESVKMIGKPLQVNFKKLNQGDYNEQIADRLTDDLHNDVFHSPRFILDLENISGEQLKAEEEVEVTVPPTDTNVGEVNYKIDKNVPKEFLEKGFVDSNKYSTEVNNLFNTPARTMYKETSGTAASIDITFYRSLPKDVYFIDKDGILYSPVSPTAGGINYRFKNLKTGNNVLKKPSDLSVYDNTIFKIESFNFSTKYKDLLLKRAELEAAKNRLEKLNVPKEYKNLSKETLDNINYVKEDLNSQQYTYLVTRNVVAELEKDVISGEQNNMVFFKEYNEFYKNQQEESTDTTIREIPSDDYDDIPFRMVKGGETPASVESQVEEARKIVGNYPIKMTEQVVNKMGNKAYGVFTGAAIVLSKKNAEGTGRHEAFHVVWEALTSRQQRKLLREYKEKHGKKSDYDLIENMADDFMPYHDTGVGTGLSTRVRRIFNYIIDFIRVLTKYPMTSKQLFRAMNSGLYKNVKPNLNYKGPNRYRIPEQFVTAQELYNRVDDTLFEFFRTAKIWYKEDLQEQYPDKPQEEINSMSSDLIDAINHLLQKGDTSDERGFNKNSEFVKGYVQKLQRRKSEQSGVDTQAIDRLITALEAGTIQPFLYRQLMSFGIKPTSKSAYLMFGVSEDQLPAEFEQDSNDREGWQTTVGQFSQKEALSQRLRLRLAYIPKKEVVENPKTGEKKSVRMLNEIGALEHYSPDEAYNTILQRVGNSTSIEDMRDKINAIPIEPIKTMVNAFMQDKASGFQTDLWTAIAQNVNPRFLTIVGNGGTYSLKAADRFTVKNAVLNSFIAVDKPVKLENLKDLNATELMLKLHKNGMMFPAEVVDQLANPKSGKQRIQALNRIEKFDYDYNKNSKQLSDLVKILEGFYPKSFQSAYYSVKGERVYSWIKSSYMGRLVNQIKNGEITQSTYSNNPLLKDLNILKSKNIDFVVIDGIKHYGKQKGNQYSNMSNKELLLTQMMGWSENVFFSPVISDSPNLIGISFPEKGKDGAFNVGLPHLQNLAIKEIEQIELLESYVAEIEQKIKSEELTKEAAPQMYRILEEMKSFSDKWKKQQFFKGVTKDNVASMTSKMAKDESKKLFDQYVETGMIEGEGETMSTIYNNTVGEAAIKKEILENVIKDIVFRTEFTSLAVGHPAQYKNPEDFYKRAKQIWSPGTYLDVTATDQVQYNVEYLETVEKGGNEKLDNSENYKFLEKLLENSVRKEEILSFYQEVDTTDAQSYIDPFSVKQRLKGLNRLNHYVEKALDMTMRGESVYDLDMFIEENRKIKKAFEKELQPFKPFYYAQHEAFTGESNFDYQYSVQNKDSEFIITPSYADVRNGFYNPKFKDYLQKMGYSFSYTNSETGVPMTIADVKANPESATFNVEFDQDGRLKGNYTDKFTYDSALKVGMYGVGDGTQHKFNYSDWRLQVETPSHHINEKVKFGTQIAKLFIGDIDVDDTQSQQNIAEYHELMKQDIDQDSQAFKDRFYENGVFKLDEFVELLRQEVIERGLGEQYLDALEMVDGKPRMPLWHPLHAKRIEAMIFSMYRKNITDRYFKQNGVTLINVSADGFNKKLKIKKNERGETVYEVMSPPHNRVFWQKKYLTNGYPDAKKVKADGKGYLLEGVLYRIPTEDKYSMFNVEVVEFLPPSSGGAIAMPEEVTSIAGLDFDIDKVFGFFKSEIPNAEQFKEAREIIKKYKNALDLQTEIDEETNDPIVKAILEEQLSDAVTEINEENEAFSLKYEDIVKRINSDNRKIEIIQSIIGKYDEQTFKAGSFDRMKANNIEIRFLRQQPTKEDGSNYSWEDFSKLDQKKQEEILSENDKLSFMLPYDQIKVMNRMNAGKALIGIAANNNVAHSMIQKGDVRLKFPITIGGITYSTLSQITDQLGVRITENISETLAAFVDNGKDPQAEYFNMNGFTADVGYLLLHLGMPLDQMQLFLAQPVLREYATEYFNTGGDFAAADKAREIMNERYKFMKFKPGVPNASKLTPEYLKSEIKKNTKDQLTFNLFNALKDGYAERLAELVRVLKDGDVGLGPDQFTSYHTMKRTLEYRSKSEEIELLPGSQELLNNEHYMNHLWQVGMKDAYNEIVENLNYPTLFRGHIRSMFASLENRFDKISKDDMETVYYEYLRYLSTKSELYKPTIFRGLAGKVDNMKKKYPDNRFLKRLDTREIKISKNNTYPLVEFTGTIGSDKGEVDRIRNSFLELLEKEQDVAIDLARYAFAKDGFSMSLGGFAAYIPVELFIDTNIGREYLETLEQQVLQEGHDTQESTYFIDNQLLPNKFNKLSFVPFMSKAERNSLSFNSKTDPMYKKWIKKTKDSGVVELYRGNGSKYELVPKKGVWDGDRQIFSDYVPYESSTEKRTQEVDPRVSNEVEAIQQDLDVTELQENSNQESTSELSTLLDTRGQEVFEQLDNMSLNDYVAEQRKYGLSDNNILQNLKNCKGF
jgi:hypothetical protein